MEMNRTAQQSGRRLDFYLIFSMLLAAFLNLWLVWKDQYVNTYYTTAVASMMQSVHNFFYGTLDSGGFVTVDKPPLTFMIQTLFAFGFGLHGWVVILPQALAGVFSVLLIYLLLKPSFGSWAGRAGALAMACTPVAAAVSRTNNIDSMLVFALLLASWFLFKGVKQGKMWAVLTGFGLIGVGFNIKMLEAYMVLPAFYFFYIIAGRGGWKKKLTTLVAATAVCAVISLSWAVIVDSVPEDERPFIGSSQTNSVLNLAFGYNGVSRLTGDRNPGGSSGKGFGGTGGVPGFMNFPSSGTEGGRADNQGSGISGSSAEGKADAQMKGQTGTAPGGGPSSNGQELGQPPALPQNGQASNGQPGGQPGNRPGGQLEADASGSGIHDGMPGTGDNGNARQTERGAGRGGTGDGPGNLGFNGQKPTMGFGGGGMFNTGTAGPLRLFESELSGQASWLLPFVLIGCISLLASFRVRQITWKQKETLFWLAWLLPVGGFFSIAGFFHQYYLIMLAPPIAALAGAGWAQMAMQWHEAKGWKTWLLPAAVLATTAFSWSIVHPYDDVIGKGWSIAIAASGVLAAAWLAAGRWMKSWKKLAAIAAFLVLLIGPVYWAATPITYGQSSKLPAAGPSSEGSSGRGGNSVGQESELSMDTQLYDYLKDHNTGEEYLFAATDYSTLAPYIIEKSEKVISLGGYSGSDEVMSVERLKGLIGSGQLKFIYYSSRGGQSSLGDWIRQNGQEISSSEWGEQSAGSGTLYEFTQDQGE